MKCQVNGALLRGVVVGTEAYSQDAPACHGYRRRSPSNETLLGSLDNSPSNVLCVQLNSCFSAMKPISSWHSIAPAKSLFIVSLLHNLLEFPSIASDIKPVPEYSDWIQNCMSSALARESANGQWGSSVDKMYNKALCNCRFARLSRKSSMSYEDFGGSYNYCRAEHGTNVIPWMMKYQGLYD